MANEDALLTRFTEYVTATGAGDESNASTSLAEARVLVVAWIGKHTTLIPKDASDRAIIEVAAELFYHKAARGGVTEWAGTDLQPFRLARDPMKAAYPILLQFIPGGLA